VVKPPAATSVAADQSPHSDEDACARAWAALGAAHARVAGLLAAALATQAGLTVTEFEMLLRLDRAPARLRLAELKTAVPLTQPALSRAVTRMADRGLLARSGAPEDGRGVLIGLTPAGREVLRRAIPVHAQVIRAALLDRLTAAEQRTLAEVLGRITAD
jgi:DNA-binding MarR family transcriptional regulator